MSRNKKLLSVYRHLQVIYIQNRLVKSQTSVGHVNFFVGALLSHSDINLLEKKCLDIYKLALTFWAGIAPLNWWTCFVESVGWNAISHEEDMHCNRILGMLIKSSAHPLFGDRGIYISLSAFTVVPVSPAPALPAEGTQPPLPLIWLLCHLEKLDFKPQQWHCDSCVH